MPATVGTLRALALVALIGTAQCGPSHSAAPGPPASLAQPVDYVDPFIGTNRARWFFFAPAALPFGMVKLSPDTSGFGGYGGGGRDTGYSFTQNSIVGFSLIHEFQLGAFSFMPTTGPLETVPGIDAWSGFRSVFRKDTESAHPGYYSVLLDRHGVAVELTATRRAGVLRFGFPQSTNSHILVDVGHLLGEAGLAGGSVLDASIVQTSGTSIAATVTFQPSYVAEPVTLYMTAVFSKSFASSGMYRDGITYPGQAQIGGPGIGFYADFSTQAGEAITVSAGVSYVNTDQAHLNLATEVGARSFDEVREAAREEWNSKLAKIEVSGGSLLDIRKFYTALWHVLLGRGVTNDVDGSYLDGAGRVRQIALEDGKPAFDTFNSDSLWGAYWSLTQVWSLAYPRAMESFARFSLGVFRESGWLPDGHVANHYAAGMPSNHATSFVANAIMKGYSRVDLGEAYDAIKKNQDEVLDRPVGAGNEVLAAYLQYGYAPFETPGYGPTAHTLEYAYEDWCASQVAEKLGRSQDASRWLARSKNYINVFDAETLMFRPRGSDGRFRADFDAMSGSSFAEGNAWQYLWFVPQDVPGLMSLMGPQLFVDRLTQVFEEADGINFSAGDENTSGFYALRFNPGNQTDLHASWLFNGAGRPDLTQYYNRRIMDTFFGATPQNGYGIAQDEDQGQLGAWFVLMAIGLFDVQGGCAVSPRLQISSPLFDSVTIHLDPAYYPGGSFTISSRRQSTDRVYIRSALLNGEPLAGYEIGQDAVLRGGELLLQYE